MADSTVRCRFAPSPTGFLHLGGARTALFSWLYARHHGGTFILRIEDTDRERSTKESIDAILDAMRWLGLDWDEGPYFQTARLDLYREYLARLEAAGRAYRCTCTPEELNVRREQALREGRKPKYDRLCLGRYDRDPDQPFVWRFLSPDVGETVVDDMVRGRVVFANEETDDLVLLKADGMPTYNFAVVVDDATMRITHVIRGEDHLTNTPRQIQLYEALQLPVPRFAHLPLIKGLSKRLGSASIQHYRDLGYLPEAMVNYIARLGWSHGDQEIFSVEELIRLFTIEVVGKASGTFNPEKMEWVNAQHIQRSAPRRTAGHLIPFLARHGIEVEAVDDRLVRIVETLRPRARTLVEMADLAVFYFHMRQPDEKAAAILRAETTRPILAAVRQALAEAETPWTPASVEAVFRRVAADLSRKLGEVAQPVRAAVTGATASPGMFEVLPILGPQETLRRLDAALAGFPTVP